MDKERFHIVNRLLIESFHERDFLNTQALAIEYLNLAAQNKDNWNYGNAIHQANTFLGLLALENNEIQKAKEYLLKAGRTPGSPQLKTFGPNMLLAKGLLEKGESEVVLEYFKLCKSFWNWFFRFKHIRKWKKAIKNQEIPDFRAHLFYLIMPASK